MVLRRLCAALIVGAAIVACGDAGQRSQQTPTSSPALVETPIGLATGQPIIIGVSVDLGGEQQAAGLDIADAVDLAIEDAGSEVAGHPILSRREDDGCNDAERASEAAKRLVAVEGVAGVIGPMCTTGAQAANDVYEEAGVVHISPTSTRADLSAPARRFFFRLAWRDDVQAAVQARFVLGEGPGASVIVVDDGEAYGRALADGAVAAIEEGGGRVLARERIERGAADYRVLARQIASADPHAVLFEGFDPEGALLVRDLRAEGYGGLFLGPDSLFSLGAFVTPAAEAAEGAIVTAGRLPDEAFTARFAERFGRAPSTPFVLQAYDATRLLVESLEAMVEGEPPGDVAINRGSLSDAVRGSVLLGLTGPISFDEQGERVGDSAEELGLAIYRVNGEQFEVVE
jgi:branched-chain amino acid transport system substrate-binding protein